MRCETVQEKLPDYVDDDVGFRERVAIEVHVARCAACFEELADLRETVELSRLSMIHPNPRNRFDELMKFIQTRDHMRGIVRRVHVRRTQPAFSQMAAAAAVIVVLGMTAPFMRGARRVTNGTGHSEYTAGGLGGQTVSLSESFVQRKERIVTACLEAENPTHLDSSAVRDDVSPIV